VTLNSLRNEVRWAVEAAQEKQAVDVTVLKLAGSGSFAEYFLLCSGRSQPQLKAISDAVEERLDCAGFPLQHREGKAGVAEWVLLDYGAFVVHVFSERAREYYDLERLWRTAERIRFPASASNEMSQDGRTQSEQPPQSAEARRGKEASTS
jgi:ribosome-associated protein